MTERQDLVSLLSHFFFKYAVGNADLLKTLVMYNIFRKPGTETEWLLLSLYTSVRLTKRLI